MRRRWLFGAAAAVLVLGAGALFFTERPLTVSVVQPEQDVVLRIYGLGSVEARILSRVGFEVGAALTGLAADVGDRVVRGQERLCCTNPVWDSSYESSVVAGIHEQTYTPDLQDQELASLQ